MSCTDIRNMLPGFIDDALSAEEKEVVKNHIASCTQCSKGLEDLKKTITLLHELEEVEPPAWFTQKIMSQIRQESQKWGMMDTIRGFFTTKIPIKVLSTISVVVIAIFLYKIYIFEQEQYNLTPQLPAVRTEKQQGTGVDKIPSAGAEKTKPQGTLSGARQHEKRSGKTINEKPVYEPMLPSKGYSDVSRPFPGKSSGVRQQESSSVPLLKQEKKGEVVIPLGSGPETTETATKKGVLGKTEPGVITLTVHDVGVSSLEVEDILKNLKAKITSYQSLNGREIYKTELNSQDIPSLIERLKKLGFVNSKGISAELNEGILTVTIEITGNS